MILFPFSFVSSTRDDNSLDLYLFFAILLNGCRKREKDSRAVIVHVGTSVYIHLFRPDHVGCHGHSRSCRHVCDRLASLGLTQLVFVVVSLLFCTCSLSDGLRNIGRPRTHAHKEQRLRKGATSWRHKEGPKQLGFFIFSFVLFSIAHKSDI